MTIDFPSSNTLDQATSLEARFRLLYAGRASKLEHLRKMASYVNPRLLPEYEYGRDPDLLRERYSSTPGILADKLTAKVVAAIYPLNNIPFFSFLQKDIPGMSEEQKEYLKTLAIKTEFAISNRLEASNMRQGLHSGVLNSMVLADTIIYMEDDLDFRVYPVNEFVLRRDAAGQIAEMIVRDWLEPDLLDDNLKSLNKGQPVSEAPARQNRLEPHYTKLMWNTSTKEWDVEKEFRQVVYEKDVSYKYSPYMHLGWERVNTEDYSRSLVESSWGDIRTLEQLTKAMVETAAAISRVHPAVSPTGMTTPEDIDHADIENLDVVTARAEDVFWLTPPLNNQLQALAASVQMTEERLSKTFLADTARSLTGERVTAYQIQEAVQEMEQALGNVLGSIAQQIQRPIVLRTLELMRQDGSISQEDFDVLMQGTNLEIKSGLDALGRQLEGARLQAIFAILPTLPEEQVRKFNYDAGVEGLLVSSGLDPQKYTYTDEQVAARDEAAQQQAVQQQATDQLIQTTGRVVENQARN